MLSSVEHEILNAHKYKSIKKFQLFLGSNKPRMLFFLLINVKMPTIVGILTFMSRKDFILSGVEHGKSFITLGQMRQLIMSCLIWFNAVCIFCCFHFLLYLYECTGRAIALLLALVKNILLLINSNTSKWVGPQVLTTLV